MPVNLLISIVDDDQSVRESIRRFMRSLGYSVDVFARGADFLASPRLDETGCLIADVNMPAMTGIELHKRLTDAGHTIPTILITAYPDAAARAQSLKDGVLCYLSKPFDNDELVRCVRKALEPKRPGRP